MEREGTPWVRGCRDSDSSNVTDGADCSSHGIGVTVTISSVLNRRADRVAMRWQNRNRAERGVSGSIRSWQASGLSQQTSLGRMKLGLPPAQAAGAGFV